MVGSEAGTRRTAAGVLLPVLLALFLLLGVRASAQAETVVYDGADLFTSYEKSSIRELAEELSSDYRINVVILTTDETYGASSMEYMENFYEEQGYIGNGARGGIVLLIDMDNRELNVETTGDAVYYITDEREDFIYNAGLSYALMDDYGNCMYAMLQSAQRYFEQGIPDNQYTYDAETGRVVRRRSVSGGDLFLALAAAFGAAFAYCFAVCRRYGTIKPYEYSLDGNADFRLEGQEDRLVNQYEAVRRIAAPRPPQGGGRSGGGGGMRSSGRTTIHRSSGGHSYGGGHGRKF